MKKYGCYAHEKKLPNYTWNLSKRQCRILLDSLIEGNGYRGKIKTISLNLCNDLQQLALHCGYSGNICINTKANIYE